MQNMQNLFEENAKLRAELENLKRTINDPNTAATIAVLSAKAAHQREQLRQLSAVVGKKAWALKQQRRVLDVLFEQERFRVAYQSVYKSTVGSRLDRRVK